MGDISQVSPSGTITSFEQAYPFGSYTREPLPEDETLGVLDRIEIDIYIHQASHAGETSLWHFLGSIPPDGVRSDSFEIPIPELDFEAGVSYCWRVRLRDSKGTWTAWAHQDSSIFSFDFEAPGAPALTYPIPIPEAASEWSVTAPVTPSLPTMAGLRIKALLSDPWLFPESVTTFRVVAQLIEQVSSETWDAGVYTGATLLWYDTEAPFTMKDGQITVRYSGRALRGSKTYLWRIWTVNSRGVESNMVGGEFFLEDSTVYIPGDSETQQPAWTLVWMTDQILLPVGLWYNPSDASNIRVIDRSSKRLFVIRQSDRLILDSYDLSGIVEYPVGLSGDPADSAHYWVLRAPWVSGAGTTGNKLLKINVSDNTLAASYNLPNGRWTAIKVSSSYVWATNWDDGKIYKLSKSDGTTIASYTISYAGDTQAEPTGIMVDGTTLYYFFYNGGSTKRFLVADESAPTTITSVVDTGGTAILGGEMDTTTHTEMYGDSDSLHQIWKYTMTERVLVDGGDAGRWLPATTTYASA